MKYSIDIFLPVLDEIFSLEKTIFLIEKKSSKFVNKYLITVSKISVSLVFSPRLVIQIFLHSFSGTHIGTHTILRKDIKWPTYISNLTSGRTLLIMKE